MKMNTYQELALRTCNPSLDARQRLTNGALGLAGESGEAADLIKKHLFHGHALEEEKLKKELGDVLWYVALLADALGLGLEEVAQRNVDKLRARYPEGFDAARSQRRDPREES
jgi:NTP pyrophosphatase (non-canonical NTP hydrolase)